MEWLVDTSVWVEHLARGEAWLAGLLNRGAVCMHPFVRGELALGRLRQRALTLALLDALPQAPSASDGEVQGLIEAKQLYGCGIGYVDAHLLASARLQPGTGLWTLDRRLRTTAQELGLATTPDL